MRLQFIDILTIFLFCTIISGCKENANPAALSDEEHVLSTLSAPTELTAQVISSSSILLTWNDNSNGENGFKIERRIGNSTNFAVIGKVDSNTIIYSDSGLLSATMYQYRVKAYIPTGVSQHSNIVEVATKPASLFTMTFPSTAGKTLTYNSTTKTGYMSQYGYSNTITEGTYYMYVRDKSTRYGKLCTK